ncbi:isoflavone reductase [Colletotrichum scovillei]|uniref:Isoflavone reductase n=1 Tax=Colletotrichum scovillei TaxID=1209932 RepID=A0A9P7RHU7_9PEZI|nr:isoflavone reductase [Colletotrichum scovillei]KAF4779349.1 isoflavone reductase [Colletotrichum scovillei]KAG7057824.1 isoflavone reductase [Colletotrichum scovillei]KAG7076421.1 isoflavone reductase [Colletotrichum scovillei]KAG7083505.1 isoflavone reductase [Colletotrichum scovillei]
MAPTIKNVALAGAGGNLGPSLLKALMDSNKFTITILTRKTGSQNFPAGVTVKEVDYESLDSLTQALKGQDALINSTNSFDPKVATRVVDAAVAAGVYRYIPPDFGLDPTRAHVPSLPIFGIKALTHGHMQQKAQENEGKFTYTIVTNGPFLDWGIRSSFMGVDVKNKKLSLFNDGENVIPYTMLADVGKAVVGTLLHPEETANRVAYIQSAVKSQKQMGALAQEAVSGSWETTTVDVDAIYANCMESIKKGIMTPDVMYPQLLYACAKKEFAQPWAKSDNALFGIKEMSDDELKALYKHIASE